MNACCWLRLLGLRKRLQSVLAVLLYQRLILLVVLAEIHLSALYCWPTVVVVEGERLRRAAAVVAVAAQKQSAQVLLVKLAARAVAR